MASDTKPTLTAVCFDCKKKAVLTDQEVDATVFFGYAMCHNCGSPMTIIRATTKPRNAKVQNEQ